MSKSALQKTQWKYFCKEVAKANEILDLIEDLWQHLELRDNAYNPVFSLIIDSLTTKTFIHIRHLFDSQDDALRLSRILTDKEFAQPLTELKKEAQPFIDASNKEHAHISKYPEKINYDSSFRLADRHNVEKMREILNETGSLLRKWAVKHNDGAVIADRWGNIGTSRTLLLEAIKEHQHIQKSLGTQEFYELIHDLYKI